MEIPQVRSTEEIADERKKNHDRELEAYREKVERQMLMVENEIKNNLQKGECVITDFRLMPETYNELHRLGYKVAQHNVQLLTSPPMYRWTISWPVHSN